MGLMLLPLGTVAVATGMLDPGLPPAVWALREARAGMAAAAAVFQCLPHNSPLATAVLGLAIDVPAKVMLPAGESILTVRSIRNPTQAELDRLLAEIKPPEIEDGE